MCVGRKNYWSGNKYARINNNHCDIVKTSLWYIFDKNHKAPLRTRWRVEREIIHHHEWIDREQLIPKCTNSLQGNNTMCHRTRSIIIIISWPSLLPPPRHASHQQASNSPPSLLPIDIDTNDAPPRKYIDKDSPPPTSPQSNDLHDIAIDRRAWFISYILGNAIYIMLDDDVAEINDE